MFVKSISAICFFLFLGCTVFEPRRAAAPEDSFERTFSTHREILDEIQAVYQSGQSDNIRGVFDSEDTLFTFRGRLEDSLSGIPRTWHKNKEIEITQAMLNQTRVTDLTISEERTIFQGLDSVVVQWDYHLETDKPALLDGTVEFNMVRRHNRFYLGRWEELPGSKTASTWGRWKMENF